MEEQGLITSSSFNRLPDKCVYMSVQRDDDEITITFTFEEAGNFQLNTDVEGCKDIFNLLGSQLYPHVDQEATEAMEESNYNLDNL